MLPAILDGRRTKNHKNDWHNSTIQHGDLHWKLNTAKFGSIFNLDMLLTTLDRSYYQKPSKLLSWFNSSTLATKSVHQHVSANLQLEDIIGYLGWQPLPRITKIAAMTPPLNIESPSENWTPLSLDQFSTSNKLSAILDVSHYQKEQKWLPWLYSMCFSIADIQDGWQHNSWSPSLPKVPSKQSFN